MERGALSTAEFREFGKDYVLFCHITSRVEGEPYADLLSKKGGGGWPYLVAMDADGNVAAKHSGSRSVEGFLATMKKGLLLKQLKRRGRDKDKRESPDYQENLDDIWELQSWLLDEADKAGIYIIENWHIEDTVRAALDHVARVLMKHFPPQAGEEVWGG